MSPLAAAPVPNQPRELRRRCSNLTRQLLFMMKAQDRIIQHLRRQLFNREQDLERQARAHRERGQRMDQMQKENATLRKQLKKEEEKDGQVGG